MCYVTVDSACHLIWLLVWLLLAIRVVRQLFLRVVKRVETHMHDTNMHAVLVCLCIQRIETAGYRQRRVTSRCIPDEIPDETPLEDHIPFFKKKKKSWKSCIISLIWKAFFFFLKKKTQKTLCAPKVSPKKMVWPYSLREANHRSTHIYRKTNTHTNLLTISSGVGPSVTF